MFRYAFAMMLLTAAFPVQAAETEQHGHMDHTMHMGDDDANERVPVQPGQGAFAAIQEIVTILENDPATDWSKVDIDALRRHLVDMNNVTLRAEVSGEPVENGIRFVVTGKGDIADSIRRMVTAHAATMNGTGGFTYEAAERSDGATLMVHTSNAADLPKLNALGFFGLLTLGAHHQQHHLAIASGMSPHH